MQLILAQDLIQRDIFEVCYSTKKEQPLWLSYKAECQGGGFSRKGLKFRKDTQFAVVTSDNADFNCSYENLSLP